MRIVGIRRLKDKLSNYLKSVREGEVVLVTDRGQAVAELCPLGYGAAAGDLHPGLLELARQRRATMGAPNVPELYPKLPRLLPEGGAARLLDELRGER
jgi:prevent-host-death family protein